MSIKHSIKKQIKQSIQKQLEQGKKLYKHVEWVKYITAQYSSMSTIGTVDTVTIKWFYKNFLVLTTVDSLQRMLTSP